MIRIYTLLAVFFTTMYGHILVSDEPVSPCPDVFRYKTLSENNTTLGKRWYGVVNLSTDVTLHSLWLIIILDQKADILGNWIGEVTTKDNLIFKIENTDFKMYPKMPRPVTFFVQYTGLFKPRLRFIYFNGRQICNGNNTIDDIPLPPVAHDKETDKTFVGTKQTTTERYTTENTYKKTRGKNQSRPGGASIARTIKKPNQVDTIVPNLKTDENNMKTQKSKQWRPNDNQQLTSLETEHIPVDDSIAVKQGNGESESEEGSESRGSMLYDSKDDNEALNDRSQAYLSDQLATREDGCEISPDVTPVYQPYFIQKPECGIVTQNKPKFLPYGSTTSEGQWPWHVAIYQQRSADSKYICGGTLVSHRHVITAAHCVTKKKNMRVVKSSTLTVYLGKFNLRIFTEGVQARLVNGIIVHPEYNSTNYSRDLAILVLRESVMVTNLVRPVCLWPEDEIGLSKIVGDTGSVVGWGFENSGLTDTELNLMKMKVVDQETCINSYSSENSDEKYTYTYTYCARYTEDTENCFSDSGSSMVFQKGSTWYLRGFVSISISWLNDDLCDPKHYIIFTDVAKFLPWVRDYID